VSVTDGTLAEVDKAEMTVRIDGVVETTSSGGSSTVTANQGTPAATASAWPVKVTDGTDVLAISAAGAALIEGAVTANGGTSPSLANAWNIKVTDGTDVADVALPGPNIGAGLVVSTGAIVGTASLTAATTGNGSAVDFGSAKANLTAAVIVNGTVTAGTVRLEGSHNGTDWILLNTSAALATGANQDLSKSGVAYRHARAAVGTAVAGGGSVTVTLMAS
jgi:hypothetical protein